jgi:hypothetical protein
MWTTFQRLTIGKICWIGKVIGGFVEVGFFNQTRFYRFAPPSWILNIQTQWFLTGTNRKIKTQKRVLTFVDYWPFGSYFVFRFWVPFWILTPSWISALKIKSLKCSLNQY